MSRKRHTSADEAHFLVRTLRASVLDGHEIKPHAHIWHQLIYASAGVMTVRTRHGAWVVPPHWALWAPAGVSHGIAFAGAASVRTLYVSPSAWTGLPSECTVFTVSPLLRELILRSVEIGMLDRRDRVHRALALLIVDAFRENPTPAMDLPMPRSEDLRGVADALARTADAGSGNAALARRFGIGLRTLERRFQSETGMSFGRWRRQARLMQGLRRMAAGDSVKAAALDAGYKSTSAFVSAFAETFQTTPGRYFSSSQPEQ